MIFESLIRTGRLREALQWDELNESELAAVAPHVAGAGSIQAMYLLGDWDRAVERGVRVRENWLAEGRPPFVPFAPDLAAVATILGLRGDEAGHRNWVAVAEEVAGTSQQLPGVRMHDAEVALHFGDIARAVELIDGLWPGFWWRGPSSHGEPRSSRSQVATMPRKLWNAPRIGWQGTRSQPRSRSAPER